FIEKFSAVSARDYEASPGRVLLTTEISRRIMEQLANNAPLAVMRRAVASKTARPWRCRTRPIKELIPDGFLADPPQLAAEAQESPALVTLAKRERGNRLGNR